MGQGAGFDKALEKVESQTLRRRSVDRQRTAELFRFPIKWVEIAVAQWFGETRRRQHSAGHVELRDGAPEFFGRFLDVLNRQYRYGAEATIQFNIAVRHHVVVSAAGDHRPLGILNVA